MQNKFGRVSSKDACGPFEEQFLRKFRGKKAQSVSVQLLKLAKTPSIHSARNTKNSDSDPNILPKLKEIEKLAKADRRKPQKVNKYVDGVSELELYIAKKLVNNLTTQQIVSKIVQTSAHLLEDRKVVTDNYLRMTALHSHPHPFPLPPQTAHPPEGAQPPEAVQPAESAHAPEVYPRLARTEYSPVKKWVSDREFAQKFDKFIIKKRDEETVTNQEGERGELGLNEEEVVRQIRSDKETITKIARDMIAEQNNDIQDQEERRETKARSNSLGQSSLAEEVRNIDWIIKECCDFEKKFKIRKSKSKRKK